jgi:hypothetical protein
MLQMFSRFDSKKAVHETKTEYHSRGFRSWNHFTSMLFGQLSGQDSLRGIEAGLASQANTLYHLGVKPVHRSTLSYANEHRSHELFKKLFEWMLSKCQPLAPTHKFRFKNPLYSIDTTVIDLCLSLFDWAKFRTTKGAVKLHVKLNHSGYLPTFAVVTTGRVHEQKVAPQIPYRLRRIRSKDPETGKYIVLLTHQLEWSAKTIAQIYKDRWQIELFFKALKQQLKVKSFVGTSRNALLSQLWIALIAYLLLCYLKFRSKFSWSLYTLCSILPTNLFSRRNLWDWLNAPYHSHSNVSPNEFQYELSFS